MVCVAVPETLPWMSREGIEYAHARGVDVHVASNMVTHEGNEKGAGEWFRELRDMGLVPLSYLTQL